MKAETYLTTQQLWKGEHSYWFTQRANNISNFIDEIKQPVSDMGERNPLIQFLEGKLGTTVNSIDNVDFDENPIDGKHGTIFCFAVIEHLFNPLFALENMKNALLPNGIIYLATPHRPHFLWTEHHYHEIDPKRLEWLFKRAGLTIIKKERHYLRDRFYKHLRGVRPIIRYFHKSMGLYKLQVTQGSD